MHALPWLVYSGVGSGPKPSPWGAAKGALKAAGQTRLAAPLSRSSLSPAPPLVYSTALPTLHPLAPPLCHGHAPERAYWAIPGSRAPPLAEARTGGRARRRPEGSQLTVAGPVHSPSQLPAAAEGSAMVGARGWPGLLRGWAAAAVWLGCVAVRGEASAAAGPAGPGHQWAPAAPGDAVLVVEDEGGGGGERVAAVARPPALAPWLLGTLVAVLLAALALLRTLQLSTLWLDPVEMYVLRDCGSEAEREACKALEPVRQRGAFVLCSLLLLGAVAHAALAVLFYQAVGTVAPAVLGVAGLVFLLAEVLPFAVSSRWGLRLAPRGLWLTQLCMLLTFPVSLPLSKVLELALRHDTSTCLLREKILDMVRNSDPYNEFVREEFSKGALRNKTVEDVLTPLDECFMLNASTTLDFNNMSMIMQSGYTRIPVYEDERTNLVDMLYVKDLAMVDPDDCTPLSTIIKFYNHPLHFVFNDTKLDAVLEEFKRGKSHMAIVQKVNNEGEGDPFYEVMGLVTLEDVIEEIIKSEIMDESDDYRENKLKKKPPPLGTLMERRKEDFSLFKVSDSEYRVKISPQLLLATQRFLSREVDLFSPARISEKVLLHLLKHPSVNQEVRFNDANRLAAEHYLYQRNQPVNYFILILQGKVEVEIGKEGLKFENGAFTYYGVSALTAPSSVHQSPVSTLRMNRREQQLDCTETTNYSAYCPDYTVRALTDLQFIKVTRLQYLNALMASRIQNSPQSPDTIELKVVPSSQTKLLNDRNATPGTYRSVFLPHLSSPSQMPFRPCGSSTCVFGGKHPAGAPWGLFPLELALH
uniref:Metal transporter n=1 Tax=Varanus komodoensis TaxID=61221 RepID=A0A8D2JI30_VARKO